MAMPRPVVPVLSLLIKGPPLTKEAVLLDRRRVFILPSRFGLLLGIFLLIMLLGGINYENNLIFGVTFLLGAVALVSMLHTYRNLTGLTVSPGQASPVFCGEPARFELLIHVPGGRSRPALSLVCGGGRQSLDLPAGTTTAVSLVVPAARRGRLPLGLLRVATGYPLGLFRAWSNLHPDLDCLVYPAPETGPIRLPAVVPVSGESDADLKGGSGVEEFEGLRDYRQGDSFRRVAWKALSRGQGLMTKQFSGPMDRTLWLDFEGLAVAGTEARLSRLCRLVLEAHGARVPYGLRLPGLEIGPDQGPAHRQRCLVALALH